MTYQEQKLKKSSNPNIGHNIANQFKPSNPRKQAWYTAGQEYGHDIRKKLKAQGCRQAYRHLIQCKNSSKGLAQDCSKADESYKECMKFYKYLTKKQNE